MENLCTLYAHQPSEELIFESLKTEFPYAHIEKQRYSERTMFEVHLEHYAIQDFPDFTISYRERSVPSMYLEEMDSPLTENLCGMLEFVHQIPEDLYGMKSVLLKKIESLNCEAAIVMDGGDTGLVKNWIEKLCAKLQALVFVLPGSAVGQSEVQHFLNEHLELLLDSDGNSFEKPTLEVKIPVLVAKSEKSARQNQLRRKRHSEMLLQSNGFGIDPSLPFVIAEEQIVLRSTEKIAESVVAIAVTNLVAHNSISSEEALQYCEKYDFIPFFTSDQLRFLNAPSDAIKKLRCWKCESIWVLMWTLGWVKEIPFPDQLIDLNDIDPEIYPIGENKNPHQFVQKQNYRRSPQEILDMLDFYYRLNWACFSGKEEDVPVHTTVVQERYRTLLWVCSQNFEDSTVFRP